MYRLPSIQNLSTNQIRCRLFRFKIQNLKPIHHDFRKKSDCVILRLIVF